MCCTDFAFLLEVVDIEYDLINIDATGKKNATRLFSNDPERWIKSMIWMPVRLTKKHRMMFAALNDTPSR